MEKIVQQARIEVLEDDVIIYGKKGEPLSQVIDRQGYKRVWWEGNAVHVHRLVAEQFLTNKDESLVVDHIDEDKTNNHPSNLQRITQRENVLKSTSKPCIGYRDGFGYWFPSEADTRHHGFNGKHVNSVILGKRKTHAGLKWERF